MAALVDAQVRIRRTLHGPWAPYSMITGVRRQGLTLWLGSLTEDAVCRVGLS